MTCAFKSAPVDKIYLYQYENLKKGNPPGKLYENCRSNAGNGNQDFKWFERQATGSAEKEGSAGDRKLIFESLR